MTTRAFLSLAAVFVLASCDKADSSLSAQQPQSYTASSASAQSAPATQPLGQAEAESLLANLLTSPRIIEYPPGSQLSIPKEVWKARLPALRYHVMFEDGTEPPFSDPLHNTKTPGTYICAASGQALFRSEDKYDSGTGWPSFTQPIAPDRVKLISGDKDHLGWGRVEVRSAVANTHLGHVFDDGPAPTGKRYCMNAAALIFIPDSAKPNTAIAQPPTTQPAQP